MDDVKLFAKNEKKARDPDTNNNNIHSEWNLVLKICHAHNEEWERKTTEGIELANQERISILREKENYKYFEKQEIDIIKDIEMKEKIRKENRRRMRKHLKSNPVAEIQKN